MLQYRGCLPKKIFLPRGVLHLNSFVSCTKLFCCRVKSMPSWLLACRISSFDLKNAFKNSNSFDSTFTQVSATCLLLLLLCHQYLSLEARDWRGLLYWDYRFGRLRSGLWCFCFSFPLTRWLWTSDISLLSCFCLCFGWRWLHIHRAIRWDCIYKVHFFRIIFPISPRYTLQFSFVISSEFFRYPKWFS